MTRGKTRVMVPEVAGVELDKVEARVEVVKVVDVVEVIEVIEVGYKPIKL